MAQQVKPPASTDWRHHDTGVRVSQTHVNWVTLDKDLNHSESVSLSLGLGCHALLGEQFWESSGNQCRVLGPGAAEQVLAKGQLARLLHLVPSWDGRQPGKVEEKQACWVTLLKSLPKAEKWKYRKVEQVVKRALNVLTPTRPTRPLFCSGSYFQNTHWWNPTEEGPSWAGYSAQGWGW